ncbi:MAG: hypothetical protein ACJ79S_13575 [Gemmatimonadaceae bacterium]
MSTRLLIRVEVDTQHAREMLGVAVAAPVEPLRLAAAVDALRARLAADVSAAYPDADVLVASRHGAFGARPTRVRFGRGRRSAGADAQCVLVAEHADALRAAAIRALAALNAGERVGPIATTPAMALDAAAAAADVRRLAPAAALGLPTAHAA